MPDGTKPKVQKTTIVKGTFRGRPVVSIQYDKDDPRPFNFGAGKARRLLGVPAAELKAALQELVSEAAELDGTV